MHGSDDICRLILEAEPQSGSWNMAVDEALLESALEFGECILRFYMWERATVSLGYFQSADEISAIPEFASLPVVRRLSGGGAILHHHELTYSCALPPRHPLAQSPSQLYEQIHEKLIEVLRGHGIAGEMRGHALPNQNATFLCFGRGDPRDIICQGQKIVGSAQRRRRGGVLQHGSILWARSPHALAYPGIVDFCPSLSSKTTLATELAQAVSRVLARQTRISGLAEQEQKLAKALQEKKYDCLDWRGVRDVKLPNPV